MNYVDLGLPSGTLWADRNVGAENPCEYGKYFNFDDAQKQGTLPAMWQMRELVDCCDREVVYENGVNGIKFTGKNGNSIFMPFGGLNDDVNLSFVGNRGFWWSCTSYGNSAYSLDLDLNGYVYPSSIDYRAYGFSVRLIKNK